MAGLIQTVAPTSEPVTRSEAILYARWEEGTDEDTLFDALIAVAREQTEAITEHQLNTASYIQYFDKWPLSRCFLLSKPPLQSVTAIKYIDQDGNEQTVDPSNYIIHTESQHRGIVEIDKNYSYPVLREETLNSVSIEFNAGYEGWPVGQSTQGVPQTLKFAMMHFVNDLWSHREYQEDGKIVGDLKQNKVAMQILGSYRVHTPIAITGSAQFVPNIIR